jgi:hypothetical protein
MLKLIEAPVSCMDEAAPPPPLLLWSENEAEPAPLLARVELDAATGAKAGDEALARRNALPLPGLEADPFEPALRGARGGSRGRPCGGEYEWPEPPLLATAAAEECMKPPPPPPPLPLETRLEPEPKYGARPNEVA